MKLSKFVLPKRQPRYPAAVLYCDPVNEVIHFAQGGNGALCPRCGWIKLVGDEIACPDCYEYWVGDPEVGM